MPRTHTRRAKTRKQIYFSIVIFMLGLSCWATDDPKRERAALAVLEDQAVVVDESGKKYLVSVYQIKRRQLTPDNEPLLQPIQLQPAGQVQRANQLQSVTEHEPARQAKKYTYIIIAVISGAIAIFALAARKWLVHGKKDPLAVMRQIAKTTGVELASKSDLWDDDIFVELLASRLACENSGARIIFRYKGNEIVAQCDDAFTTSVQAEIKSTLKELAAIHARVNVLKERLATGGLGLDESAFQIEVERLKKQRDELRRDLRRMVERTCILQPI